MRSHAPSLKSLFSVDCATHSIASYSLILLEVLKSLTARLRDTEREVCVYDADGVMN